MTPQFTHPPVLIETPETLRSLAERLMQTSYLAIDTESNSMFAYQGRVCLIQISLPDADYLLDPLAIPVLDVLAPVFAAPHIQKVFHAADYDLMMLRHDFGLTCKNLFDTMWAARILGWPRVGLGHILTEHFSVTQDKRYQRYNWATRPLTDEAVRYARTDTHYLLQLRARQEQELLQRSRWEEAQEIFLYLAETQPGSNTLDLDRRFWQIRGIHDLRSQELRALYGLHLWREQEAQRLDRPVNRVVEDDLMIELADIQPHSWDELCNTRLTQRQVQRYGRGILRALNHQPERYPDIPEDTRPANADLERYNALKLWRKDLAFNRGVDPDVILPNAVLWDIVHHPPRSLEDLARIPGIGPWRQAHYGPAIIELMKG